MSGFRLELEKMRVQCKADRAKIEEQRRSPFPRAVFTSPLESPLLSSVLNAGPSYSRGFTSIAPIQTFPRSNTITFDPTTSHRTFEMAVENSAMSPVVSSLPPLRVPLSNAAPPVVSGLQVTRAYGPQSFGGPQRTAQYRFPGRQPQIQLFSSVPQSYDEFNQHVLTAVRNSMLEVFNTSGVMLSGGGTVVGTTNEYVTSRPNADT